MLDIHSKVKHSLLLSPIRPGLKEVSVYSSEFHLLMT